MELFSLFFHSFSLIRNSVRLIYCIYLTAVIIGYFADQDFTYKTYQLLKYDALLAITFHSSS